MAGFDQRNAALLSGKIRAGRTGATNSTRARHTLAFKLEAVPIVKGGQSLAVVSKVLAANGSSSPPATAITACRGPRTRRTASSTRRRRTRCGPARHHVHRDRRRTAATGGRHRPVQLADRGLVGAATHASRMRTQGQLNRRRASNEDTTNDNAPETGALCLAGQQCSWRRDPESNWRWSTPARIWPPWGRCWATRARPARCATATIRPSARRWRWARLGANVAESSPRPRMQNSPLEGLFS